MHPPPLPPGAVVPKWDHFCSIVRDRFNEVSRFLDEASNNGWELVSWSIAEYGDNLACFKRPRLAAPGGQAPAPAAPGA